MMWLAAGALCAMTVLWLGARLTRRPPPAVVATDHPTLHDPAELRSREDFDHDLHDRRNGTDGTATILITLQRFDELVATHGEQTGSDVRTAIAMAIAASLRDDDISYRFADDEFAVLLTGAEDNGARRAAHRIRRNLDRHEHSFGTMVGTLDSSSGDNRLFISAHVDSIDP